jgi:hypothetical protein
MGFQVAKQGKNFMRILRRSVEIEFLPASQAKSHKIELQLR